jgi:hypothetical protein
MRAARNYRVEDQIIQFLTGLNEHFAVVKTQILLMDPLPSMNKVYSLVIQEESNNSSLVNSVPSASVDDSNILVNAVDSKKSQNRGKGPATSAKGKDNRHCTYCDRGGHTVDGCFKKHGYPNPRSNSAANSIDLEGGNGNSSNGATVVASTSSNIGISQEQYNNLLVYYNNRMQTPQQVLALTTSIPLLLLQMTQVVFLLLCFHYIILFHVQSILILRIGYLILVLVTTFVLHYIGLIPFILLNLYMSIYLMVTLSLSHMLALFHFPLPYIFIMYFIPLISN